MPRKKHSELTAGLFVVAGIVVLLGVVLWLGAADLLRPRGQLVSFWVPMSLGSVGIIEGAEVTCGDGRVGRVISVLPDPVGGRCLYRARMERSDFVVKRDANALVISPPVGQAKVVLMSLGTADEPGDDSNPVLLTGGLDQAMQRINKLAENLEAVSQKLRFETDRDQAKSLMAKVRDIADKINGVAGDVRKETTATDANSLFAKLHKSAGHINAATGSLKGQTDPNRAGSVMAKIHRIADNVETETDPNARGHIVAGLRATVGEVYAMIRGARPMVDGILTDLSDAAATIEGLTRKDLTEMLRSLREANTMVLGILDDFSEVSQETKELVKLNRDNVDEIIDNLAQASATLKSALKEVRRNPWRVFYQPDEKELDSQNLYDAARRFSNGAVELDQALAKLRSLQKMKSDDELLRKTVEEVRKALEASFGKFTEAEHSLWKELQKKSGGFPK